MRRFWVMALLLVLGAGLGYVQQAADAPVVSDQSGTKKITPPEALNSVEAEYPADARLHHVNGLCNVRIVVDVQGNPQDAHIIHCTDSAFEQNSLSAVKQYRFKPASTQDGKPVPVMIHVQISYHLTKYPFERHLSKGHIGPEISAPIQCSFIPQQDGASVPDSDGVYPLTRSVTGPRVIKFSDEGYGHMAFDYEGNSPCDIVLTISAKGKATDPQVTRCERPELKKPAIESLLKSQYKPGMVKGKAVPMRVSVHLEYGGDAVKP